MPTLPIADFRGGRAATTRSVAAGRRWLAPAAALPLIGALALLLRPTADDVPATIDLTQLAAAAAAAAPEASPLSVEVRVESNDTLDRIFRSVGIDHTTLSELRQLPDVRKALDVLRPGDIITLTHTDGALLSLNRRISNTLTLSVARAGDGYAVDYIENPFEVEVGATRAAPRACPPPP